MSFSIIIPTMWMAKDQLQGMLFEYDRSKLVKEILIIDNAGMYKTGRMFGFKKVHVFDPGGNIFVNPSWNIGVERATAENILIANDDITVEAISRVLHLIKNRLYGGMIIGPDKNCFAQKRTRKLGLPVIYPAVGPRTYGYGVFMAMRRYSYIPIPDELKVWYGDSFLYNQLDPLLLDGVDIVTKMRSTSKTMDLSLQHKLETKFYEARTG